MLEIDISGKSGAKYCPGGRDKSEILALSKDQEFSREVILT